MFEKRLDFVKSKWAWPRKYLQAIAEIKGKPI